MLIQELGTIITGMTICDVNGKHIGIVDKFVLGGGIGGTAEIDMEIGVAAELKQIIGERTIFENLNADVYKTGFLHIECGLFQDNVIVFPYQIDNIDSEEICLNISKDDLLAF